jgi:hypothetical protein
VIGLGLVQHYIANHPSRHAAWGMKVMPALDEPHFNETIPVMAALSVFESACGKGRSGSGMLYVVGVELMKGPMKCEIDFMILVQDAELPAVIVGEAKAGHPDHPEQGDLLNGEPHRGGLAGAVGIRLDVTWDDFARHPRDLPWRRSRQVSHRPVCGYWSAACCRLRGPAATGGRRAPAIKVARLCPAVSLHVGECVCRAEAGGSPGAD